MSHKAKPTPRIVRQREGFSKMLRAAVSGLILMLSGSWAEQVLAVCEKLPGVFPPDPTRMAMLPATIQLKAAAIGEVVASYMVNVTDLRPFWVCDYTDKWGMGAFSTNLRPIDVAQGLYESGVTGIGIRIRFHADTGNWNWPLVPPFERNGTGPTVPIIFSNRMRVEFVRTGIAVGKGDITPFDVKTDFYIDTSPQTRIRIEGVQLKTQLQQNIYFTSCYNPSSDPLIDMGRPAAPHIKRGEVTEHQFSLDIRCDGMNPTTKPPVKIYFEGNAVKDGLLRLTGDGQPDVAKGVGIALTNDKGVALPFAKARAMPLTWQYSSPDAETYRFTGKARYTATGGEITAGRADATLTYVLEYN